MFSLLKRRFKQQLALFISETMHIKYEAQNWTRTISCPTCTKIIPVDACFCTYCGQRLQDPQTQPNIGAIQISNINSVKMEPVHVIMPRRISRHRFINYVRAQKGQVGPATIAHRDRQDLEERIQA